MFLKTHSFICGCGHSGTSLLANMFAAHPAVYVPKFETKVFLKSNPRPFLRRYAVKALLSGRRHFVEKTPIHIYHLEDIRRNVPGARIILMVRDGRDVSASFAKRYDGLDRGNKRWLEANEIVLSERNERDCLMVRYEDIVRAPEQQLRTISDFTGIGFDEAMLRYHENERMWFGTKKAEKGSGAEGEDHRNLRNWQVNQPIFDGSGKWKRAFPEGAPAEIVTGRGAELMRALGYDPDEKP